MTINTDPATVTWADRQGKRESDEISFRTIAYDLYQRDSRLGPITTRRDK